jgi:DNA repair protein RecN (Recombination protein N)
MLEEIRISNFAIIDQLELHFTHGLNVISGETGAGKSIIIRCRGGLDGWQGGAKHDPCWGGKSGD